MYHNDIRMHACIHACMRACVCAYVRACVLALEYPVCTCRVVI